jgi:hypothetical protein
MGGRSGGSLGPPPEADGERTDFSFL